MVMITTIPCSGTERCATLEHDWLKHQLLNALRGQKSDWVQLPASAAVPDVLVYAEEWIGEAENFATDAISAFSPSHLVDSGPLSPLPAEARELIKEAVHEAYLDCNVIQPLAQEVRDAVSQAGAALRALLTGWRDARGEKIDALEDAALCLQVALRAMPKGVILP